MQMAKDCVTIPQAPELVPIKPLPLPVRAVLISTGTISMGLGVLGVFLPGLPTTPFLLLASACYIRSSERMYRWLRNTPLLRKPMRDIIEKRGLTLRAKLLILGVAFTMMAIATFALWHVTAMRFVFPALAVMKTVIFFTMIKTIK